MIWLLAVLLLGVAYLIIKIQFLIEEVRRREFKKTADHAMCLAHVSHYVGDAFAAQILRLAAEDLDSVEGQTELRRIGFDHKNRGPSIVNRWLHARADRLIWDEEEAA